ncbi:hypothetical protein BN871_IK_00140 [Paenibacillus sp. P22]|nr:hypothetical protein BN871_IK_00140 [Paenibacillus sp. P22]
MICRPCPCPPFQASPLNIACRPDVSSGLPFNRRTLFAGLFRKRIVHQLVVIGTVLELSGGCHDVEQVVPFLFVDDRVIRIGSLLLVAVDGAYDDRFVRAWEVGSDGIGDFLGAVLLDPGLRLLDRVRELLHRVLILLDVALLAHEDGIRQMAALHAERSDDLPLAFLLHHRSLRLEQLHVIARSGRICRRNVRKVDILDQLEILVGVDAFFLEGEFARHLRHSALALAEEGGSLEIAPVEGGSRAGHEERSVGLRHLGKVDDGIVGALLIDINGRFGADESDVDGAGQQRGHRLVAARGRLQLDIKPFVLEEAFGQGDIFRSVEERARHFADTDLHRTAAFASAAGQRGRQQQRSRQQQASDSLFFHMDVSSHVDLCVLQPMLAAAGW